MEKKDIIKIILILCISFIISKFLKTKIDINYDNVELNANIEFFHGDEVALAHRKLHSVPLYGIVSTYFTPKKISARLLDKLSGKDLSGKDFCLRNKHAEKRNAKIISKENSIKISLIFLNKENAYKCEKQIREYFDSQFKLFIKEANEIIEIFEDRKNLNNIVTLDEDLKQNDIYKDVINFLDEQTVNILRLQSLLENRNYSMDNINEYLVMIDNLENFKFSSSIDSNSIDSLNKYLFEILFLLVSLLSILIIFRKKIEIYFDKIKNNL